MVASYLYARLGGRKVRISLEALGQARTLEAPRQGGGWVFLDWKEPVDDGKTALRSARSRPTRLSGGSALPARDVRAAYFSLHGAAEIGTVKGTRGTARAKALGSGQERGKEWEYRVIAVNKAGEGTPSNTVMAVL